MRFFEPDETSEVSVTLTKKDWLIACEMIKAAGMKDPKLRDGALALIGAICDQAAK